MSFINLSKKLNEIAQRLGVSNEIEFITISNSETVAEFITLTFPFSKVAIFYTETSFTDCAFDLCKSLKIANLKPINLVLNKDSRLSIDNIKGLFNVSEDVRYLIVTDNALVEKGLYFATVMNIPVLFMVNGYDIKGITAKNLLIDNGDFLQTFKISSKRVVALEKKRIMSGNISDAIALVGGKISGLIDYKIHSAITGEKENITTVQIIEDAIDGLLSFCSNDNTFDCVNALFFAFSVEIPKLICDTFYNCSSAIITALLAENVTLESAVGEFFSAKKIIKHYLQSFNMLNETNNIASNYNDIAQKIQNRTKLEFSLICEDILYKIKILSEYSGGVDRLFCIIKNILIRAQKEINKIDKMYKMYGGSKSYLTKSINEYLKISGYVKKVINGATLAKEI